MKVSFYTLGCRLNQSETAVLQRSFEANGYRIVRFEEPADIVVVNTCTVTQNGDTDTRRVVHKINRLNPRARIALIGCQAQIQKEKLTHLPNVHFVVGNAHKMDLADIVRDNRQVAQGPVVITPTIPRNNFTIPYAGIDRAHTRANLKIQDGCDFFCSFCEIPFARGRARSRVFDDILKEAKALTEAGHREVVLTGINLGTYAYEGKSIVDVICQLQTIDGLRRIRISSIEPTTVPEELIEQMSGCTPSAGPLLCRHLHLPLQSASDEILRGMQRKYTRADYHQFVKSVLGQVPEICLGTDIIVGFPGETQRHFEETLGFLNELPFGYIHVFSYSHRMLARSQKLPDPIPGEIIERRSEILRDLSANKRSLFLQKFLGTRHDVLFEEEKRGFWVGKTEHYVTVKVKSSINLHNRILPVQLEHLEGPSMIGRI